MAENNMNSADNAETEKVSPFHKYLIPKEIDDRIPRYFYHAMAGELFAMAGPELFKPYEELGADGKPYYDLDCGCGVWDVAFRQTCVKLGMPWLLDYYHTLGWEKGDRFDGIIEQRIIQRICTDRENPEYSPRCYYDYARHTLERPFIPDWK